MSYSDITIFDLPKEFYGNELTSKIHLAEYLKSKGKKPRNILNDKSKFGKFYKSYRDWFNQLKNQQNTSRQEIHNQILSVRQEEMAKALTYPGYRFPIKENIKKYCTHKVAHKGAHLIDIMFAGIYQHLLVINVNTRYLYARTIKDKSKLSVERAMKEIITEAQQTGNPIITIQGDAENAFVAIDWNKMGIIFIPCVRQPVGGMTAPYHPQLAIIDRVTRTIRDMHDKILPTIQSIDSDEMEFLVRYYNNHPHSTLSRNGGRKLTPSDVQHDPALESNITYLINVENMRIMNQDDYWLKPGQHVYLYQAPKALYKHRSSYMLGDWVIKEVKGVFYLVENQDNTNEKYWVTRHRLDPRMFSGSNPKSYLA